MRTTPQRLVPILACLAGALLFVADMALPQFHFWALYLLCLVGVYRWGTRRNIYVVAAFLSLLLIIDYLVAEPRPTSVDLGNYVLRFAVLWAVAWLLAQRLALQEHLVRQKQQLEQEVQARTLELRASEQRQRVVAERFTKLFHSSPNPVILSRRADGCILEVNDAFAQVSGYTRGELIGSTSIALEMLTADARASLMAILGDQEYVRGLEFEFRNEAGAAVPVLSFVDQVEVDGEACLLLSFIDIGERKRIEQELLRINDELENHVAQRTADLQQALADLQAALTELQRADKLKDEFMAIISHELRTPLMGILSLTELLAGDIAGPLNRRQADYVRGIRQSGDRLLAVVNGILSYIQLLAGTVELEYEPVALAYLLNSSAAARRAQAGAKQQTMQVVVDPADLNIASDATALAEILRRLLDNAIKFTPEGGQIGIEAHAGAPPGTVQIVVWDTGMGIAADQFEHIVQPFVQADGSLTRDHEGVGMGLAYVHQMVVLLGGRLDLESEPGHGSRFTITLPAEPLGAASVLHLPDHLASK